VSGGLFRRMAREAVASAVTIARLDICRLYIARDGMSSYPLLSLRNVDDVMVGLTRWQCSDMDRQKVFDPLRNALDLLQAIDPANMSNSCATDHALLRSRDACPLRGDIWGVRGGG